jgi:hypothetical protein
MSESSYWIIWLWQLGSPCYPLHLLAVIRQWLQLFKAVGLDSLLYDMGKDALVRLLCENNCILWRTDGGLYEQYSGVKLRGSGFHGHPIGGNMPRKIYMSNKKLPSKREIIPASSEGAGRKRALYTDEFKRTAVARLHSESKAPLIWLLRTTVSRTPVSGLELRCQV